MSKKFPIIISVILVLISAGLYVYYIKNKDNLNSNETNEPSVNSNPNIDYKYLLLDDLFAFSYNNGSWRKVNDIDSIQFDKKFITYVNNEYYGLYDIKKGNVWNLFNDGEYVNYNGHIIAFSNDFNIQVRNVTSTDITGQELSEISQITGIDVGIHDLNYSEVLYVDLDQNGTLDKIVSANNNQSEIMEEKYFSIMYIVLNEEITPVIEQYFTKNDKYYTPSHRLEGIINIENKAMDSILIKNVYFSNSGEPSICLFEFNNNKYRERICANI